MPPLDKSVLYTACCVVAMVGSATLLAQDTQPFPSGNPQQVETSAGPAAPSNSSKVAITELPDSPGASRSQQQAASGQSGSSQPENSPQQGSAAQPQSEDAQTSVPQEGQKPQRPVGTAAAEAPPVNGITAAQPSGVAIAPAKQRRVRTIVLKVGAIVGVGVAVGTTMALTMGTSSKPPGAH